MSDLETEIIALIIEALDLERVESSDIGVDDPLFGDGLGLDSIDALELGVALRQRYGIKLGAVTDEVRKHFSTVHNLALFVEAQRTS